MFLQKSVLLRESGLTNRVGPHIQNQADWEYPEFLQQLFQNSAPSGSLVSATIFHLKIMFHDGMEKSEARNHGNQQLKQYSASTADEPGLD